MVLIIGGTGKLGSRVAQRLLAEGRTVRVLTRSPARAETLKALGAEVAVGNLRDAASLRRACQGAETVVAAAHAIMGKGNSSPQHVDDLGNRQLIDAAREARVKHFVFISALDARDDHPIDFFRIKHKVEGYLKASGLSYTILRPPAFMETWAGLIGEPIVKKGKTTIFGPGTNPVNFMAVDDVAHYVLVALNNPEARNRTLEIGGPENLTLNEVARIFERVTGKPAKKSYVPLAMLRLMSMLMKPFHAGVARLMAVSYRMATANQRFDPSRTLKEFPYRLTRLEELAGERYGVEAGAQAATAWGTKP